jgi:hypothetical protein
MDLVKVIDYLQHFDYYVNKIDNEESNFGI